MMQMSQAQNMQKLQQEEINQSRHSQSQQIVNTDIFDNNHQNPFKIDTSINEVNSPEAKNIIRAKPT